VVLEEEIVDSENCMIQLRERDDCDIIENDSSGDEELHTPLKQRTAGR
jgi:hypothetical protein